MLLFIPVPNFAGSVLSKQAGERAQSTGENSTVIRRRGKHPPIVTPASPPGPAPSQLTRDPFSGPRAPQQPGPHPTSLLRELATRQTSGRRALGWAAERRGRVLMPLTASQLKPMSAPAQLGLGLVRAARTRPHSPAGFFKISFYCGKRFPLSTTQPSAL